MNVIGELNDKYGNAVFRLFTSIAECREGQYRMHRHTQYEIGLIERGCGFYDTEHGREEISSGDVFLFSANEYHCITDIFPCGGKRDMQILNLQFLPGFISDEKGGAFDSFMRIFTDRKPDFRNKLDENNRYTGEIQNYMLRIKEECEQKRPCYDVLAKGLLCALLVTLYRYFGLCDPVCDDEKPACLHLSDVMRAAAYMNEHYCEDITLAEILAAANLGKTAFTSAFHEVFDMTAWDYLNIKRIEKSLGLLKNTYDTVLSVAAACGYNNTANFNRIFRKITGLTPRQYRVSRGK
ncbi:MAG: AraC family transcriptional regulator [Firmicutes bacterium]|nr:AraC family transcriptional regulator [Bacillota bacterium]MDY5530800.1 AraC family transcriptional regulator [Pumilibacteraceae bacterium]